MNGRGLHRLTWTWTAQADMEELSAHYLQKTVTFDFVQILSSAYIDQSAPNLGKIFMSNRI